MEKKFAMYTFDLNYNLRHYMTFKDSKMKIYNDAII